MATTHTRKSTRTYTIVAYVERTPECPNGTWKVGLLWNHRTGFFPEGEAEVKNAFTGVIHHTRNFQVLYPNAPVAFCRRRGYVVDDE